MKRLRLLFFCAVLILVSAQVLYAFNQSSNNQPPNEPILRIPFEYIGRHVVVPVSINGSKSLKLILDTGMPTEGALLFHVETVNNLGLKSAGEAYIGGVGDGSPIKVKIAQNNTISIGSLTLGNPAFPGQLITWTLDSISQSQFIADGIIGGSIFHNYIVELDFDSSLIKLYSFGALDEIRLGLNIPLQILNDYSTSEIKVVNDKGNVISIRVIIDLGAGIAMELEKDSANGIVQPAKTVSTLLGFGLQGDRMGKRGRIDSIQLGNYWLPKVIVAYPTTKSSLNQRLHTKGLIGMGLLRRFNLVFDYSKKKLYLKPNKFFNDPFESNMAGLELRTQHDSSCLVTGVISNSPGEAGGIKKGDLIISVDGVLMKTFGYQPLDSIFTQEGKEIEIVGKRATESYSTKITLRRLL